jgi:hypothetical protein
MRKIPDDAVPGSQVLTVGEQYVGILVEMPGGEDRKERGKGNERAGQSHEGIVGTRRPGLREADVLS